MMPTRRCTATTNSATDAGRGHGRDEDVYDGHGDRPAAAQPQAQAGHRPERGVDRDQLVGRWRDGDLDLVQQEQTPDRQRQHERRDVDGPVTGAATDSPPTILGGVVG